MTEHSDDEAVCPHPMREGENTSNPDHPGRCLLCGTPWDQVEAERQAQDG